MQQISHPDGPDNEELTRSIDNSLNVPCITNQRTFLTSPLSWSLELSTQINTSVESLILQIEDELSRPHERVNGIIPGYPQCSSPPNSDYPYGGNVVIPCHYFYDMTNWQTECTTLGRTYPL